MKKEYKLTYRIKEDPDTGNLLKLPALMIVLSMLLMCSCSLKNVSVTTKKNADQPVKLTMFATALGKEKTDDNEIRELIAEKTGVKVVEIWQTGQYSRNVIDGLLDAGNLPDFLYVSGRLDEFYERGFLVAWDEYIEKYPNIKNLYTEEEWDLLRQADGHIYSVNIPGGPIWNEAVIEGRNITNKAGFAVTTGCKDPDIAFKFINDILSKEITDLRFWGIEGIDYKVSADGSYYRDSEMTDNWNNDDYGIKHVCQYNLMPAAGT